MKVLFVLMLVSFNARATDCLRVANPMARMIYLHGVDISDKSEQERQIRKDLEAISRKQKIEIYLPRSSMKCPNDVNQVCWMWGAEASEILTDKKEALLKDAKTCFQSNKPLLWLGFSNGGNRLHQFFQACLNDKYITIASSGGYINKPVSDLSKCGELYLAIGKKDIQNYKRAQEFFDKLKTSKAKVKFIDFDGGHEIRQDVLSSLLKSALQ